MQNDAQGAGELITELVNGADGVLRRYHQFEQLAHAQGVICSNIRDYERYTGKRPPLVFIVVDELNALLEIARKGDELQRSLTILLQTGAAAGYYVVSGAQYLTARSLPRDASSNFVSRAHFGNPDPTALRMLFGHVPEASIGTGATVPGRGYIRVQGQPAAVPFQGIYCDERTLLDIQAQLRPTTRPTPTPIEVQPRRAVSPAEYAVETAVSSPEKFPAAEAETRGAAETLETQKPHGNELETVSAVSAETVSDSRKLLQVAQLLRGNSGKKAIIEQVWGATSGRRYMAASSEYDAILAQLNRRGA